jgi:hypothetical protein
MPPDQLTCLKVREREREWEPDIQRAFAVWRSETMLR